MKSIRSSIALALLTAGCGYNPFTQSQMHAGWWFSGTNVMFVGRGDTYRLSPALPPTDRADYDQMTILDEGSVMFFTPDGQTALCN